MKAWVIKHKPTGTYMPQMVFKSSGGWTSWGPGSRAAYPMPRLFETAIGAQRAADAWARGVWEAPMEVDGGIDEPEYSYRGTPGPVHKVDGRRIEDIEVIGVELPL